MRFHALRLVLLAAAIFAVAGLETSSVRADEKKGEPSAEISKVSNATNSQSFKPKENGLKRLEQDLFKPFETMAPQGSLDGAFVAPAPEAQAMTPTIQSRRAKELLERKRDWAFETPDEILAAQSTDDILNKRGKEKDSDDKSNLSPLERFYQRLYDKDKKGSTRKGNKNRDELYDSSKSGSLTDQSEADDDADLPLGVRETQHEMRKLLAPKNRKEGSSTEPSGNGFQDVFGLSKSTQSREEMEMQRERMDRYKTLVGLPVTPTFENDPLKRFRDIVGTSPKNSSLFPSMDSLGGMPQQNLFGVQSGATLTPNTSLLPEGAQIHTAPSLAPVLPKIEPPKMLPPPVTFSVPRRQF